MINDFPLNLERQPNSFSGKVWVFFTEVAHYFIFLSSWLVGPTRNDSTFVTINFDIFLACNTFKYHHFLLLLGELNGIGAFAIYLCIFSHINIVSVCVCSIDTFVHKETQNDETLIVFVIVLKFLFGIKSLSELTLHVFSSQTLWIDSLLINFMIDSMTTHLWVK